MSEGCDGIQGGTNQPSGAPYRREITKEVATDCAEITVVVRVALA